VNLDEGEFVDVGTATLDELEDAARLGALTDVKTLVGLLWLRHWREGRWDMTWVRPDAAADAQASP
jgi:ADP-ribose pyrophosphatase